MFLLGVQKFVIVQICGDMNVKQYPYYLFVVGNVAESKQDDEGNWTESTTVNTYVCRCRDEVSHKDTEIAVAGGTFHKVTSIIYMPKGIKPIADGTTVFVSNDAAGTDIRIKGEALKFDPAQLHCRLWL